jgi:hypothetical protein
MRFKLIFLISILISSTTAFAINETSTINNVEIMTYSADAKTLFSLNCYAANYIFLQYIKKSNIQSFDIQSKLDKQAKFYAKLAISNMEYEKIDRKSFEKFNEWNLTYFNALIPFNNKIDFKGALWQQIHECNIKFERLKNEKNH